MASQLPRLDQRNFLTVVTLLIAEMPALMKRPEPLYTVAQAAEIVNVSEKTVRRWIDDGDLRAITPRRTGRRRGPVRIAPADLEDFIRGHRSR
jgi:excisionase family DNA binding protein